jgi:hypothetical protein
VLSIPLSLPAIAPIVDTAKQTHAINPHIYGMTA